MNRFTPTLVRMGTLAALAASSLALTPAAFAAPPATPVAVTAADLRSKADHHAMMAADYRARARVDEKHAIQWLTLANHCDQKAQRYRTAALAVGAAPRL